MSNNTCFICKTCTNNAIHCIECDGYLCPQCVDEESIHVADQFNQLLRDHCALIWSKCVYDKHHECKLLKYSSPLLDLDSVINIDPIINKLFRCIHFFRYQSKLTQFELHRLCFGEEEDGLYKEIKTSVETFFAHFFVCYGCRCERAAEDAEAAEELAVIMEEGAQLQRKNKEIERKINELKKLEKRTEELKKELDELRKDIIDIN